MTLTSTSTDAGGNPGGPLDTPSVIANPQLGLTSTSTPTSLTTSTPILFATSTSTPVILSTSISSTSDALLSSTSSPGGMVVAATSISTNQTSSTSSTPTANAATSSSSQSSSSNTGLIAGIAVLAVLFAIALAAAFFFFRQSRKRRREEPVEYAGSYEPKSDNSAAVASLESNVATLEAELQQKDAQLKESHALLLSSGRRAGAASLSDKQVSQRFVRISKEINDWVVTHFKSIHPGVVPAAEVDVTLQAAFPNYGSLLQNSRTKYLVLRGLVAEVIFQAFSTGEFFGSPAFSELRQSVGTKASTTEQNEWRALTMTLLEKSPSFAADRAASVEEVSKKIDLMAANLAGLDYSESRLTHLRQVVGSAAALATDIAKERSLYIPQKPPGTAFDAATMEDVLQDHKGEELQDRPIEGIVFPMVIKVPEGEAEGGVYTILKAQVLV